MEHYLDVGASSGDLTTFKALERYCATATAACNLEYSYNGHTVMEYITGAKPRTRNDVVIKPVIDDVPLTELDAAFLTSPQSVLFARLRAMQLLRDDTARDNSDMMPHLPCPLGVLPLWVLPRLCMKTLKG